MRSLPGLLFMVCLLLASCHHKDDGTLDRQYEKMAEKLYLDGHREASVKFLDSVYASGYVSPLGKYLIYSKKTQYYNELHDPQRSMLYADSSILVLGTNELKRKYQREYSHALLERGHVFSAMKKMDSAYNCYLEGYSFVYATGNTCYLHEFDYFMGMMLYKQQRLKQARTFFIRSFINATTCADQERPYYRMQEVLSNIGLTYKKEDSAVFYFDSCLSFIEKNKNRFATQEMVDMALGVASMNKSFGYYDLHEFEKAEDGFRKAAAFFSRVNTQAARENAIRARIELSAVYYLTDKNVELRRLWEELRPELDTTSNILLRVAFIKLEICMYESEKNFEKAYETCAEYWLKVDSLNRTTHRDEQANALEVMKNKEHEYNIGLLKRDAKLQRTYLWILIVLSGLAVVIILLVYSSYKRTRRTNKVISDQKQALERGNAALDKSNREKNKILNVVAHDLRSPVSAVAYLAESVIEDGEDSTVDPVSALTMIKNSSLNSLALINELSVFARDEQEGLSQEQTDMAALLQVAMDLQVQAAAGKEVKLELTAPEDTVMADVDRNKITRVMSNLIDNAIKFSRAGSVVRVGLQRDKEGVLLQVQDNGIGIPPHLLPELFEMFTPAGRKGTKGERSFGLGLSICRQIAEAHGGKIWVESTEGVGSTFYLRLPLA